MNWTVQYAEYYLYRGVSRTNAYEFMQQSGYLDNSQEIDARRRLTHPIHFLLPLCGGAAFPKHNW